MQLPDRKTLAAWRDLDNPACVVVQVWAFAAAWTPSDRDLLADPSPRTVLALKNAVEIADGRAAAAACVEAMAARHVLGTAAYAERQAFAAILLGFLTAADDVFQLVHPRTVQLLPGAYPRPPVPRWLKTLEISRVRRGWFAEDATHRLVPRGPFSRAARAPAAAFADSLPDRFSAISVVPKVLQEAGRSIAITITCVGSDAARGVPPSAQGGRERVAFVPVAEGADELDLSVRNRRGRDYLDCQPAAGVASADRIVHALRSIDGVDMTMAPELVVSPDQVDRLKDLLRTAGRRLSRVVLAGSGLSAEKAEDGRSYNEARLINGSGADLMRQRKVWPFGMARSRATHHSIKGLHASSSDLVMEDVAAGGEVVVADIAGLGRLVILICQDFEARPLADELVREYQPDWILVPILDGGIRPGGWVHSRAFGMSGMSQGRFMVANSLTLWRRSNLLETDAPAIGLAVGPRDPTTLTASTDTDASRAIAFAVPGSGVTNLAVLTWREDAAVWTQTELNTKSV